MYKYGDKIIITHYMKEHGFTDGSNKPLLNTPYTVDYYHTRYTDSIPGGAIDVVYLVEHTHWYVPVDMIQLQFNFTDDQCANLIKNKIKELKGVAK